jgi:hypothetical protein
MRSRRGVHGRRIDTGIAAFDHYACIGVERPKVRYRW